MKGMKISRRFILVFCGLAGWALCAAVMGIGMAVTSLATTLIVHAVAAPLIFAAITWFYFSRYGFTSPLRTAEIFVFIVVFMDVFVVAMVIQKSFAMFESFTGTWLPFILIFASTLVTGYLVQARQKNKQRVIQDR
jgi:hypothetical protein